MGSDTGACIGAHVFIIAVFTGIAYEGAVCVVKGQGVGNITLSLCVRAAAIGAGLCCHAMGIDTMTEEIMKIISLYLCANSMHARGPAQWVRFVLETGECRKSLFFLSAQDGKVV